MADKHINGSSAAHPQKSKWTDGLPHSFEGWGPKTPDPETEGEGHASVEPNQELTWSGEVNDRIHHVWHFDGRRRHH